MDKTTFKLATWNVNSIRIRLDLLKKLAEKLKDDYDKATASQEVKELKSATKLYEELYRKRYEKATILINQKNVDGYIETYHIKKSVT